MVAAVILSMISCAAIGALPVNTAETVPPDRYTLALAGGFALVRVIEYPIPIPSGEVELAYGIADGADVRARYVTHLGAVHRFGPELRARLWSSDRLSIGARIHPWVQLAGSVRNDVDFGMTIAATGALLATARWDSGAITAEVGAVFELLLYEHIAGASFVDDRPRFDAVALAVELEAPLGEDSNFTLRVEALVPSAPDDPFVVLGVHPRIVAGTSFSL